MKKISEICITEKGNYEYEISYVLNDESLKANPIGTSEYDRILNDIEPDYTGVYCIKHPEGNLKTAMEYLNGSKQGLMQKFHSNGQKAYIGEYKEGLEEGVHESWYDNGKLRQKQTFAGGVLEGVAYHWFDNGQLLSETPCKNGVKEGIVKCWYDNGQLEAEWPYSNGKIADGLHIAYYNNSQVKSKTYYKNGKAHGIKKTWHRKTGKLIIIQGYYLGIKNGIVKKEIFCSDSDAGDSQYKIDWLLYNNERIEREELLEKLNEEGLYDEWKELGIILRN